MAAAMPMPCQRDENSVAPNDVYTNCVVGTGKGPTGVATTMLWHANELPSRHVN